MLERIRLHGLRACVPQDDLAEGRQPRRLAVVPRIQHIAQCPRHLFEAPLVEAGVEHPAAVCGLLWQLIAVEDHLGFQPSGGPHNAAVRDRLALGIRRRHQHCGACAKGTGLT